MSFDSYLAALSAALKRGDATEHTHRPALKTLIESLHSGITATNEPKRIACGAPDYIVTKGHVPVGYVEAKDVNADLDEIQDSEQLKRYRASLRNLFLTDYLEFRYYRNGEFVQSARIGKWQKNGVLKKNPDGIAQAATLFQWFLTAEVEEIGSPRELARKMATLARMIRDLIGAAFVREPEGGELHAQYEGFRQVLLADLTHPQFADMYAQTICYGLFAARCNHFGPKPFSREAAASELPKTNPFLRKVFQQIAGHDLDDRIAWAVDDLALLLARADMVEILKDFGRRTRQEDPVVHFYETFLAAYDSKLRESRGVYYTPEPVVSYIVRSVDEILRRDFGLKDGLADSSKIKVKVGSGKVNKKSKKGAEAVEEREFHRVQILDPATGTGTFLFAVIDQIRQHFKGNAGMWPGYVAEHLLPRLYGFELLIAPYAVAHMKLGLQLSDSGYDFATDERLRVYLTNTLEEAHELANLPLFARVIAEEAANASEVKKDAPIMVVLGNPPYSGHSANKGTWIQGLLEDYKRSPELKKPAQGKWLSDDYVKFMRFAQWRIEQTGYGVLAYISNHGYLDNPTFKDMRESLLETFDDIHILDLHGNSKKKEKAPDGGKDVNVFDIQQGVAIGIFVKKPDGKKVKFIKHADLWGARESKYAWLYEHSVGSTKWNVVSVENATHLFIPQDDSIRKEYETAFRIQEVFSLNGDPAPGIVTTHDDFAISWTREEAIRKVERLLTTKTEAEARELFTLCGQDQWSYERAKNELPSVDWRSQATQILYRPFDLRWTIYNRNVAVHRRERASNHLMEQAGNLGLVVTRQTRDTWSVLATNSVIAHKAMSAYDINSLVPLYLYPNGHADLFDDSSPSTAPGGRKPNISSEVVAVLRKQLGLKFIPEGSGDLKKTIGPEDIFHYAYALFYSPTYRGRYVQFLKADFPRLPLTSSAKLFRALQEIGTRLVESHLMKGNPKDMSKFPIAGSNEVAKIGFTTDAIRLAGQKDSGQSNVGRVYINSEQYFEGVPTRVWEYHIGGYQVCEKWLKDRKGRLLSYDDIKHYHRIVSALAETIELQEQIDAAIPSWPIK